MIYQPQSKTFLLFIAYLSFLLGQLSIYLYLPVLSFIATDLNITTNQAIISVTIFLIGLDVLQIIPSYFINILPWRLTLTIGYFIYIISSLALTFVTTIHGLYIARLFQGFGCSVGQIILYSIIYHLYGKQSFAKPLSSIITIQGIITILSPLLATYFQINFGWRTLPLLMSFFGILFYFITLNYLPSNLVIVKSTQPFMITISNHLKNRHFIGFIILTVLVTVIINIIDSASSDILTKTLGLSMPNYSIFVSVNLTFFTLGVFFNRIGINKFRIGAMLIPGLLFLVIGGSLLYYWGNSIHMPIYQTIIFCLLLLSFGLGILYPNYTSLAFSTITDEIASATAIFSMIRIGAVILFTLLLNFISDNTLIFISKFVLLLIIVIIFLNYFMKMRLHPN